MDYKKAGVDIEAGYKSVELMKEHVKRTMREEVLGGLGGFSGAFSLKKIKEMEDPVLLSGTDGCGTKVKLAMILDKHDTIGIDAVAMCVNDIACAGGEPLFFLDYIACGKNYPEKIASIVSGVAEGCVQSDAALIGGETAEHPGLMPEDEYDLAGFAVGVCDRKDMITGENLKDGDVLIGMASTGVHSNGFSLVRKVFEMTRVYLQVILFFAPAFMLNDIFVCFVRNDGAPRRAMCAMLLGSFSNIVLDYIFMYPLHMGIFGAVLATGCAPIVGIWASHGHWKKKDCGFHFRKTRPEGKIFRGILALGVPSLITELASGVVMFVFNLLILNI